MSTTDAESIEFYADEVAILERLLGRDLGSVEGHALSLQVTKDSLASPDSPRPVIQIWLEEVANPQQIRELSKRILEIGGVEPHQG